MLDNKEDNNKIDNLIAKEAAAKARQEASKANKQQDN